MAKSNIGREIWYANNNGFIAGSTVRDDEVTGTIIDTYNEHFGTRITHLTPEANTYNMGDRIQNWNAYEKIEMPQTLVAVAKFNNLGYVIGEIVDNTFICDAMEENVAFSINNNGVVEEVGVRSFSGFFDSRIKPLLETRFEIEGYTMNLSSGLVPGNPVPNWNKYIIISE